MLPTTISSGLIARLGNACWFFPLSHNFCLSSFRTTPTSNESSLLEHSSGSEMKTSWAQLQTLSLVNRHRGERERFILASGILLSLSSSDCGKKETAEKKRVKGKDKREVTSVFSTTTLGNTGVYQPGSGTGTEILSLVNWKHQFNLLSVVPSFWG